MMARWHDCRSPCHQGCVGASGTTWTGARGARFGARRAHLGPIMATALNCLSTLVSAAGGGVAVDSDDGMGLPAAVVGLATSLSRLHGAGERLRRGTEYAVAVAVGVASFIAWCWDAVAVVEEEVVRDGGLTAAHVQHRLSPVASTAAAVEGVITPIAQAASTCSAAVIDSFVPRMHVGDVVHRQWFATLAHAARTPLCHQMQAWLGYGDLEVGTEFFVRRASGTLSTAPVSLWPSAVSPRHAVPTPIPIHLGSGGDAATLSFHAGPTAWEGGGGGGNSVWNSDTSPGMAAVVSQLQRAVWEDEWRHAHSVDGGRLPTSYVTPTLASTVCLLGKVVSLLRRVWRDDIDPLSVDMEGWGEDGPLLPDEGRGMGGGLGDGTEGVDGGATSTSRSDGGSGGGAAATAAAWTSMHSARIAAACRRVFPPVPMPAPALTRAGTSGASWSMDGGLGRDDGGGGLAPAKASVVVVDMDVVALRDMVDRVRKLVLRKLWALLQDTGGLRQHAVAIRQFVLLGRGDLFRSFWELGAGVMAVTPATSAGALTALTLGPWQGAAAISGVYSEGVALSSLARGLRAAGGGSGGGGVAAWRSRSRGGDHVAEGSDGEVEDGASAGWDSGGGGCEADMFDRCHWGMNHGAVRWACAAPGLDAATGAMSAGLGVASGWEGLGLDGGGRMGSGLVGPYLAPAAHALTMDTWGRSWYPPRAAPSAKSSPRADVAVTLVGGAHVAVYPLLLLPVAVAAHTPPSDSTSAAAPASAPFTFITPAPSEEGGADGTTCAGAVWLASCPLVTAGFMARFTALLHFPAFPAAASGASGVDPGSDTASFSFVVQREGPCVVGKRAPPSHSSSHGGSGSAGTTPAWIMTSGFTGITSSLAVQVLVKRLPAPSVVTPGAGGVVPPQCAFRVVAAVYAPEGTDGDHVTKRRLLASAVLHDVVLPLHCLYTQEEADRTMAVFPLTLTVEYVAGQAAATTAPPLSFGDVTAGGSGDGDIVPSDAGDSHHRLRVHLLAPSDPGQEQRSDTAPTAITSAAATATRALLDCPLVLEGTLDFLGWSSASRGRAWVGFTGDASPHPTTAVHVSLEGCDLVAMDGRDGGYGGLYLDYAVPWPLHVVFDTTAVAVLQDVFRVLYRAKSVSHGLQDVWATLMQAGSGGSTMKRSRSSGGVSRQVSGVGGKRSEAASTSARSCMALQGMLQPVWLLRAQMAAMVDAILFHFQVDVIQGAFQSWMDDLLEADDFQHVVAGSEAFVKAIRLGAFLTQPSLANSIDRLLAQCDALIRLVTRHATTLPALLDPASGRPALTHLTTAYHADMRMFTRLLLASSRLHDTSPLLVRLNFNGYHAGDV